MKFLNFKNFQIFRHFTWILKVLKFTVISCFHIIIFTAEDAHRGKSNFFQGTNPRTPYKVTCFRVLTYPEKFLDPPLNCHLLYISSTLYLMYCVQWEKFIYLFPFILGITYDKQTIFWSADHFYKCLYVFLTITTFQ